MTPELQAAAERWQCQGADLNMLRAFAHVPEMLSRFLDFYGPLVNRGRVSVRMKELARMRIAQLNDCHY
jgi:alkylhydroperoxidase family enzyme